MKIGQVVDFVAVVVGIERVGMQGSASDWKSRRGERWFESRIWIRTAVDRHTWVESTRERSNSNMAGGNVASIEAEILGRGLLRSERGHHLGSGIRGEDPLRVVQPLVGGEPAEGHEDRTADDEQAGHDATLAVPDVLESSHGTICITRE